MAYLGRGIENLSDRVVLDALTASATASYTLQLNSVNFVPSSASSLTVSLNGVIQKPDSSYTVSGSTLTFSSALTSSDSIDFIIAERGITLQTPSAGSVNTEQLANDAVTKDKVSNLMYPAFEAVLSSNQNVSNNVATKVQFNTEIFDTDNMYDNSTNYRFTPTVAGKYFVYASIKIFGNGDIEMSNTQIYKNGSLYKSVAFDPVNTSNAMNATNLPVSAIIDMNGSSDYLEIIGGIQSSGTTTFEAGTKNTYFGAYRIGD